MVHKTILSNLTKKKYFYLFIFTIFIIKSYFIFFDIKPTEYTGVSWTWFDFYNAKQFIQNPSSITDPGHPGTPVYYIYATILKLVGSGIGSFAKFQLVNHIFYFLLFFFSFQYFFNFFKKKINEKKIIIFFFILFSFQISFVLLEVVSNTVVLLPLSLILIVQSFKINQDLNYKILLKFCFTLIFTLFTKVAMLPYVLTLCIAFFYDICTKKKFKFFFIGSFFLLIFICILNFPILGRLPSTFFNVFFTRADTLISIDSIFNSLFLSVTILFSENPILTIFIIITIIMNIYLINKFLIKKNYFILILNFLFLFFFIYTFIAAGEQAKNTLEYSFKRDIDYDIFFRNNIFYIIYLFYFLFQISLNERTCNALLIFSIIIFLFSLSHYDNYRKNNILTSSQYSYELKKKIRKYVDINKDNIAYWSTYKKYGISNEIIHFKGNYIWGNEKFDNEIINYFPNIRLLRVNDIINKLNEDKVNLNLDSKKINFKEIIKSKFIPKYENYIKNNFNSFFYNSLSTKSFYNLSVFVGDKRRSGEVYTGQESRPINLKLIAFTFPKNPNDFRENYHNIIEYINKTIPIERIVKENVLEDLWYFILLKG